MTTINGWGANCAQGQHCNGAVAAGTAMLVAQFVRRKSRVVPLIMLSPL